MHLTSPRKDLEASIDAARKALAGGDLPTTERLCKLLVERAPQDGRAWALLTETALQRNRPDAAMVCADRAVALAPDDPIAHIMRAKCLFFSGEFVSALTAAEAASKIPGASPEAEDALGAIFGLLGRHHRALEFSRRAAASRPDVAQYLFNLAATERMLGMLDAAEIHCDATIALDRRYALAYYLRSDLRIQTADRNNIAQMEVLIEESKLDWRSEVMLRFALGKEYEDLEEHGRAFDHVKTGADLQRSQTDHDCRAEIAEIDRIISTQTRTWLARAPAGFSEAEPVFVVGLPRTGTALVGRIIGSHSAMISAGETGAFAVEVARAIRGISGAGAFDLAGLGKRRYVDSVTTVFAPEKKRFIDKTLQNYLYCGLIHAALPRAKIVLVQRHPLDTGWALYKAHFQNGFSFSYDLVCKFARNNDPLRGDFASNSDPS